jgi:hypothetical protein
MGGGQHSPYWFVDVSIQYYRIQIPVRKALEAIGANIEYDHASRTNTATLGETAVKMQIGSAIVEVNGVQKTMDTKVNRSNTCEAVGIGRNHTFDSPAI